MPVSPSDRPSRCSGGVIHSDLERCCFCRLYMHSSLNDIFLLLNHVAHYRDMIVAKLFPSRVGIWVCKFKCLRAKICAQEICVREYKSVRSLTQCACIIGLCMLKICKSNILNCKCPSPFNALFTLMDALDLLSLHTQLLLFFCRDRFSESCLYCPLPSVQAHRLDAVATGTLQPKSAHYTQ